ncbi:MAG: heme lyase CcmF/NrfE family subunit, partial [Acidimicrobiales bacterium]
MNGAVGFAGVVLGAVSALFGLVSVAVGLARRRRASAHGDGAAADRAGGRLLAQARPYSLLLLAGAAVAVLAMERALITRDFSVQFVHDHGSHKTPALYNMAALWSALEGSILLWALVLAGYIALVLHKFRSRLRDPLVGWAALTLFAVALFFFGLLLGPANPFGRVSVPLGYDGPGPNPLLQNHPLMVVHPPMLYLGYVGFTVPFAFAIAALVTGRVGEGWLLETRRWTLFAWGFLSAGIVLGAWWSYEVLNWGGYWAWDPVENASFLPWLTGTAFLHSVMVQERRGMLRVWNLSLVCATFALTVLGTFLTRSGVVESVHAFSAGSVGGLLLAFFAVVVVVCVGLIGWRGDRLRAPGRIDSPLSREGAFLANNVLFAAFAFVVLLGTVFPLVIEALQDERITVGGEYFRRMTAPVGFTLLFLMAVAPALPWRKASAGVLRDRLHWPAWLGVGSVVLAVAVGARGLAALAAFGLGGFAGGAALRQLALSTRRGGWRGLVGRANGGMVVHLGVVLLAVGFAASSSYVTDREVRLAPGESAEVAGHTLTFLDARTVERPEKISQVARVAIDGGQAYAPSWNRYRESGMSIGEPSVRSTWRRDVWLVLAKPPGDDGRIDLRVVVQPLVAWLWAGGAVIVLGSALAAAPGRRRRPTDPASAPSPLETEAEGGGRRADSPDSAPT